MRRQYCAIITSSEISGAVQEPRKATCSTKQDDVRVWTIL